MKRPKNRFEIQVARIHEYLKTDRRYNGYLPRPFLIEVTGPPASGKTTTITELDKFLRRHDFRVLRPQEGAEVIRHIPRTTPVYNLRTGLYALQQLVDFSYGHAYDVVIFNRCIFDVYVWMMYWQEKGLLEEKGVQLYQAFFLSPFWTECVDIAYIMTCNAAEAMKREMRIALSDKLGETSNPDTIRKLATRYRTAFDQLSPIHPQLRLIDTTTMDEVTMVEKVASITLDAMEAKIKALKEKK